MLIIFSKIVFKKNYSDAGLLVKKTPSIIKLNAYKGRDSEILKELKPNKNETSPTAHREAETAKAHRG